MENLTTKERFVFRCGRWLSKKEDDKQIIRELPAEGPGISRPLPLIKYTVDVYTGSKSNAGTDANVFIDIFGDVGDTGGRCAAKSDSSGGEVPVVFRTTVGVSIEEEEQIRKKPSNVRLRNVHSSLLPVDG